MADVFISYKRDQRDQVLKIAERLQDLGLSVWFDARLEVGSSFDEEIAREVRAAKAVFVCWSPEAVASRWVRAEASIGLERDVLVAAFLHPVELIPPYNLVHAANLEGWMGDHAAGPWQDILARIGRLVGQADLPQRAKGKALEAQWLAKDGEARAAFASQVDLARASFAKWHGGLPATFEARLSETTSAFEAWLLKRRVASVGPAPDPTELVGDDSEALRLELETVKRERDAALAGKPASYLPEEELIVERERENRPSNVSFASTAKDALLTALFGPVALAAQRRPVLVAIWVFGFVICLTYFSALAQAQNTTPAVDKAGNCYDTTNSANAAPADIAAPAAEADSKATEEAKYQDAAREAPDERENVALVETFNSLLPLLSVSVFLMNIVSAIILVMINVRDLIKLARAGESSS